MKYKLRLNQIADKEKLPVIIYEYDSRKERDIMADDVLSKPFSQTYNPEGEIVDETWVAVERIDT